MGYLHNNNLGKLSLWWVLNTQYTWRELMDEMLHGLLVACVWDHNDDTKALPCEWHQYITPPYCQQELNNFPTQYDFSLVLFSSQINYKVGLVNIIKEKLNGNVISLIIMPLKTRHQKDSLFGLYSIANIVMIITNSSTYMTD